jgi:integrase
MCERLQVSEVVRRFLAWLAQRSRPATVAYYTTYLERFARHVEDCDLGDVKRLHVETFSVKRGPLVAVKAFLRWCWQVAELLPANPAAHVRTPRLGRRCRVLSRAERVLIRRHCDRALYRALLAMEQTACRPQELRALTWSMVRGPAGHAVPGADLGDGRHYFELRDYKSRDRRADPTRPRIIPITPRLGRLLNRLRRAGRWSDDVIFRSSSGRPWSANALRCAFRRLRRRLQRERDIDLAGVVPYTYRHTRATDLARAGLNAHQLREWMGHTRVETTAVYCHLTVEDMLQIARRRVM